MFPSYMLKYEGYAKYDGNSIVFVTNTTILYTTELNTMEIVQIRRKLNKNNQTMDKPDKNFYQV